MPALADDSGLCVDAFGGAPGVHSARYAQTSADDPKCDARNNAKLLAELSKLGERSDRNAHFVSVIVFVRHADDPQPIIAEGEWHGEILAAARGSAGFGYDPLFYIRELEQTSAELSAAEKNRRSHRGQALARLLERLSAQRR
jgi:XTP/dITP diphosphohydrolase